MNKVELIGNVGKDPKIMETRNGKKIAKFSLATNENFVNGMGERKNDTQWHRIMLWPDVVATCEEHIVTGTQLHIIGKLVTNSYTGKDGVKRSSTEVVGMSVEPRVKEPAAGVVG